MKIIAKVRDNRTVTGERFVEIKGKHQLKEYMKTKKLIVLYVDGIYTPYSKVMKML